MYQEGIHVITNKAGHGVTVDFDMHDTIHY